MKVSRSSHDSWEQSRRCGHARNWPLPAPLVPRLVVGPAARLWVRGQKWGARLSRCQCAWPVGATRSTQPAGLQEVGGKMVSQWFYAQLPAAGQILLPTLGYHSGIPSTPKSLAMGHLSWSNSHLGFFFQVASKVSRQSAFLATRALRRLSVLGCSLWVGYRSWRTTQHPQCLLSGLPRSYESRWASLQDSPAQEAELCPFTMLGMLAAQI